MTSDYEVTGQNILVDVSGVADITNATLNLALAGDYTPKIGSQFTLLTADTILGAAPGGLLFGYEDGEDLIVDNTRFHIEYLDDSESNSICLTASPLVTLGLVDNGCCPQSGLHSYTLTATGPGIQTLSKFTVDGELHQVFHEGEASAWLGDDSASQTDTTDSHVIFGDMRFPDMNGATSTEITEETIDGDGDSGMGTLNNYDESLQSYDAYTLLSQPSSDPDETLELMQLVVVDGQGFTVDLRLLTSHNYDPITGSVSIKLNQLTYSLPSAVAPGDANRDGIVDKNDAIALAQHWLQSGNWDDGDFNGDGLVNELDATLLAANWTGSTTASVPEPNVLLMLFMMLIAVAAGRSVTRRK